MFRFNGKPAIGLAIAMQKGGNIQSFGKALHTRMDELTADLPVGVGVHKVSDQAEVVEEAVGGFTSALFEAVIIVLVVSFISLGMRAGLVVACSIPLVLALVFVFMEYSGITMQRVSLGALIIALGLLVDDAMITVEMMITRLEKGETKEQAATYAYTSTAFPMLTGTLVTVAGFRADWPQRQFGGRVHLHPVRGDCRSDAGVVGGGGAVCAGDWRAHPQCQGETPQR